MHIIRCSNITHRRNSAGNCEETIESEYYLNEPEDGEILYSTEGDDKEPVVFRHGICLFSCADDADLFNS